MSIFRKTWFKFLWLGILLLAAAGIFAWFMILWGSPVGWPIVYHCLRIFSSAPWYPYYTIAALSLLSLSIFCWLRKPNWLTLVFSVLTAWFLCNAPVIYIFALIAQGGVRTH
jgi:hypothetical protein